MGKFFWSRTFMRFGTSADQDTRFSNKQAKLLKTQKFAQELDHLVSDHHLQASSFVSCDIEFVEFAVDMTKVKMDVMKPWIAKRVTELLGFEDEVLINFVYGLLDAKVPDSNTAHRFYGEEYGKFMKELWVLLLSAQKNASGVPQQFLDEKEEEMKKKMDNSGNSEEEGERGQDAIQMNLKGMPASPIVWLHVLLSLELL
ncbi:unnamed protein product [Spirodela intermedia]|uniref:PWI domain-containing protein n=1 Tax=Spirodela intermedia TaxID=51605 RepID=A0A7I8II11_SPIIN|nr:unnamed protein product [Spirodela intermedia]CAA6656795.1 unnamed protein product [Spirodela intermedia]